MSIGHFIDFDQSWRKFYDNKSRNGTFVNHFACMLHCMYVRTLFGYYCVHILVGLSCQNGVILLMFWDS